MVEIRPAVQADAPALGAVHVRAWQQAYRGGLMPDAYLDGLSVEQRSERWEQALEREPAPGTARLVAEHGGIVVGFVVVGPAGGEPGAAEGEVYALNVDPGAWGHGAGRALLEAGARFLREAGFSEAVLWVHPDNRRARDFYELAGWRAENAERREDVLGVEVPEVRYRRALLADT